ncbi:MAG: hypothetical protein V3S05_01045, partial [Desulfobacterales bacterium]
RVSLPSFKFQVSNRPERSEEQTMPKILAIDDKQDNLITVAAVLKSLIPDCEVITAQSGPEGIKKAKAELGIKAFVMKPFAMSNLAHSYRRVLDEK